MVGVRPMLQHAEHGRQLKRFGLYSKNNGILDKEELEVKTLSSFIWKTELCIPYGNDAGTTLGGYPVAQEKDGGKESVMKYLRGNNYWLY